MRQGRRVFQRLHQVGRQRVLQQHGHRTLHLEVTDTQRPAIQRAADHHAAQSLLQVLQ